MTNNDCPICEAKSDKKLPIDDIQRMICHTFSNEELVTVNIFSIADALIDKWQNTKRNPYHFDEDIHQKLVVEVITDEGMEHVKQWLINFATRTNSTNLFRETIILLTKFNDPNLKPLLQGWLNKYYQEHLAIGSTINELVNALESTGENVRNNKHEKYDWEANAQSAKEYLSEELNIHV